MVGSKEGSGMPGKGMVTVGIRDQSARPAILGGSSIARRPFSISERVVNVGKVIRDGCRH